MSTKLIQRPIVDLSHWQPEAQLRWADAVSAGIVGLIAKASQGSGAVDPELGGHLLGAWQAGVQLLGGYHFLDSSDPTRQAQHFLTVMDQEYGRSSGDHLDGILLALDLEGNPMGASETVAGAAEVAEAIQQIIGRWPVLYMGHYGPDGQGTGLPNATLSKCDLWLPAYGSVPRMPKGWAEPDIEPPTTSSRPWLWQDTDGTANRGTPVPGLGRVDQSQVLAADSLEALAAWWGGGVSLEVNS